ncbi:protein Wnt-6-like [Amphibalanus amphitrite]|uniref:protein Wnt-6-like n=1 Tax=Amphibalanus amphitrite TaxID=1232801 RepID=UPI001C924218|nr:protein Wnt-6-like [Amphibalanus amphitrite]XP_043195964.1 protein Wnt-6-like [Amphibalanus amphitrite]
MRGRLVLEQLMRLFIIVVCLTLMVPADAIWWAIGSPLLMDPDRVCRRLRHARGRRSRICRRQPEVIEQVHKGVALATKECQFQFQNRRWNCTTDRRSLKRILMKDLRETGFVNAITSAGLMHAITAGCSRGHIIDCTCEVPVSVRKTDHRWSWSGCGDNAVYGYKKSRQFLEALFRRKADVKTLIMLHNNEVGRLAIRRHMRLACKCHGLSGSCTVRTCWRRMPQFREVGDRLRISFDKAVRVMPGNDGKSLAPAEEGLRLRRTLVYAEKSPSFCEPNRRLGSLGSQGRRCQLEGDGCLTMCCERGFTTVQLNTTVNCRCRFHWCCEVTCDKCPHVETQHFCR